jgi:hypothetical protein
LVVPAAIPNPVYSGGNDLADQQVVLPRIDIEACNVSAHLQIGRRGQHDQNAGQEGESKLESQAHGKPSLTPFCRG